MSGRIVGEVFEHAPEDLTQAQMMVLLSIAEQANEKTRIAKFRTSLVHLERRTRLKRGTLKNALGELVRRGLIARQFERGQIGTVQHYRVAELLEHHRNATATHTATPTDEPEGEPEYGSNRTG